MTLAKYSQRIFSDGRKSIADKAVLAVLAGGEKAYSFGIKKILSFYQSGRLKQEKLGAFVISVGNITVGGTGKTPLVQYLAGYLQTKGYRVVVISRGYQGEQEKEGGIVADSRKIILNATQAGDEAYLLARNLPGVPVIVGKDKAKSGRLAIELFDPQFILIDDGFQHWHLQRDIDIVLIDCTKPFSNGHVLPRGLLREPLSNLARAQMFILTKSNQAEPAKVEEIKKFLLIKQPQAIILETIHQPFSCVSLAAWRSGRSCEDLTTKIIGKKVLALSALGNPAAFEKTVAEFGMTVAGRLRFPDHYRYVSDDLAVASKLKKDAGADFIIVTEKDAAKIIELPAGKTDNLPDVYVLAIKIEVLAGEKEGWDYIFEKWETKK